MRKIMPLCTLMLVISLSFSATALAGEITVSAAASLTNAFTEIKEIFEKQNPKIKVITNFAASNPLLKQIETGAPVDVFASADQATMNRAEEKKFLQAGTRKNFAANALVLIAPAGNRDGLKKAVELVEPKYSKIAIGNPDSVPAGRYAREVLQATSTSQSAGNAAPKATLWAPLQPKFIMAESVRQVLDYVVRGEVQAGFVYSTDARQAGGKVVVIETLAGHSPVLYPVAVLERSKNKKEAQMFVDFVLSAEGQNILNKYGFSKP